MTSTVTQREGLPEPIDGGQTGRMGAGRFAAVRILVALTVISGGIYIGWRWLFSLNLDAWWIAIPLVLAETYAFIDVCFFGMTLWRARSRPRPEPPRPRTHGRRVHHDLQRGGRAGATHG